MFMSLLALAAAVRSITPTYECPVTTEQSALGIVLLGEDQTTTIIGTLVTCRFSRSLPSTSALAFNVRCSLHMTLIQAGYYIEPPYTADVRVVGFIPKPLADGTSAVDIEVAANNSRIMLSTYAYCKT